MSGDTPDVFEKLQTIREADADDIEINKDTPYLQDHLELRPYQKKMVLHLLLMKRFVVGDSTGLGKCQRGDAMIQTDRGLIPLRDLGPEDPPEEEKFYDLNSEYEDVQASMNGESYDIERFYYDGTKPTKKIVTKMGYEIECSLHHPIRVQTEDGEKWIKAENICDDHRICIDRSIGPFPDEEPEIEWMEGSVDMSRQRARLTAYLMTHDPFPAHLWDQVGLDDNKIQEARTFFRQNYSISNGIPSSVLQGSRTSALEFLRTYLTFARDPDETCFKIGPHRKVADDIHMLLLQFGVVGQKYEDRGTWYIKCGGSDLKLAHLLRQYISWGQYINLKEKYVRDMPPTYTDRVRSIEDRTAELYDIEVDHPDHAYVGNGIINHNTIETLSALGYIWKRQPDMKCLIVTPTSAMRQWGSEMDRFMQGVDWTLVEGGPEDRERIYRDYFNDYDPNEPEALIVNYHRLRRDKRDFLHFAQNETYTVISDEATAFKNPKAKTHHAMRAIGKHAERFYGLTATLIKNNLVEGYGIFKVVKPQLFGSKRHFQRNYCVTRMQRIQGGRKIPIVVGHSQDQIDRFNDKIEPYYYGRPKHEVADQIPTLTTKDVPVKLSNDQWTYYLQALDGLLSVNEDVEVEEDAEDGEIDLDEEKETNQLTELIYTQEIVDSPYLIGNHVESRKADYLVDLIENELRNEKVVIYTRFKEMVDRLADRIESNGYAHGITQEGGEWVPDDDIEDGKGYVRITGDEDDEEREAGKQAFKREDGPRIIFLTDAGSHAINLQNARVLVFYDLPWSAGNYLQCLDDETEVLTPNGWKGRTQIQEENKVASFDAETSEIEWSVIQNVVDRDLREDENMYELKSKQLNVRVTGGHRMLFKKRTTTRNGKPFWPEPWRFETAEDMSKEKSHFRVPVSGIQESKGVSLTQEELEFIGWYISDGCINPCNSQLVICQSKEQPQIEDLRECIKNCGFDWNEYERNPEENDGFENGSPQIAFSIPKGTASGSRERDGWNELKPYLDKDLSPRLEEVSKDQLRHLLRGIHLGDGAKQRGVDWTQRSYHIYTVNKTFADRLQSLCVRRGIRCHLSKRERDGGKKNGYTIHIKDRDYLSLCGTNAPNRPGMTRSASDENERVWCVKNENNTLVTRRKGKVMIVGNCLGRILRIGSPHDTAYALHLIGEGPKGQDTIDDHVLDTLDDKMDLVEKVIGQRVQKDASDESDELAIETESETQEIYDKLQDYAKQLNDDDGGSS